MARKVFMIVLSFIVMAIVMSDTGDLERANGQAIPQTGAELRNLGRESDKTLKAVNNRDPKAAREVFNDGTFIVYDLVNAETGLADVVSGPSQM